MAQKALLERAFPKLFQMKREKYLVTGGGVTAGFVKKSDAVKYAKRKGRVVKRK